tara:strand:- start:24 stop:197 length:174 start_codon:yes stop_codon:yes gene_type:complete
MTIKRKKSFEGTKVQSRKTLSMRRLIVERIKIRIIEKKYSAFVGGSMLEILRNAKVG